MKFKMFQFKPWVKLRIVSLFALVAMASCNETPREAANIKETPTTFAAFKFEKSLHDFGELVAGDTVNYIFKFENSGKVPLVIHDISTACGCTVLEWSKEPISPEEQGTINIQFSNHEPGFHHKQFIVKANTKDPYTVLHFKAQIKG